MSVEHKDTIPEVIDDWLGVYLYRTVEDLAANNCEYSPKRDLARAELHGKQLSRVIDPALASINSLAHDTEVTELVDNQILPELRKLDIQSAKEKVWQQVDSMPSSKVRERVCDVISHIHWLKARGFTIDPGDEAFLQLNADEQEALVRQTMKQLVDIGFSQLRRYFLAILNRIRKGKMPLETCPVVKEMSRFLPWRATLDLVPLANNPTVTNKLLCPENKAVVEDREAICGWGGDSNTAFERLTSALRFDLEIRLRVHGWAVPGSRFSGLDTWDNPRNEEIHMLQVGLFNGMKSVSKQSLPKVLIKGATGQLRNYFIKAAKNRLFQEIRSQNRRLGINVPPDWSCEGKTEDEIRKGVDRDIDVLSGREVLNYDIETADGSISTLQQAGDKQAFEEWQETEAQRKALITEKVQQLISRAKLTPRLRLVASLYDKPNEVIATSLEEKFHKPFTVEAVRALKHDLLVKLKEASEKK